MNSSLLGLSAQNIEQGHPLAPSAQDLPAGGSPAKGSNLADDLPEQTSKLRGRPPLHHLLPLHQQNIDDQNDSAWTPLQEGATGAPAWLSS